MKNPIHFSAALVLGAAIVSCEKPLQELNPSLDSQSVTINSGETVTVKSSLNDVRGNTITADVRNNAAEQYDINVVFDNSGEAGIITITAPSIILDDTPFDIDLSFSDVTNNKSSSAKITVTPVLVSGLAKFDTTANTFIVSSGVAAVFPTAKGNSRENADPASIKVEWQDNADLFSEVIKVGDGQAIVSFAETKEGKEFWFPLSGNIDCTKGTLQSVGGSALYNTRTDNSNTVYYEQFAWGNPASETGLNRPYAASTRCIKE